MSEQNPYEKLGVTENASFEEIQDAKQRLKKQYGEDQKALEKVEMAYDAIIMDRLRLRQEGKIKVPERIRFPERSAKNLPDFTPSAPKSSPSWLQQLLDTPSRADILWSAVVFLGIAGVAVFYQNPQDSLLPLLVALGFGANIYFLNRKENRFGRSVVISLVGLLAGMILGSGLASFLESQGLGASLASEQLTALVTFCFFWLSSSFLR